MSAAAERGRWEPPLAGPAGPACPAHPTDSTGPAEETGAPGPGRRRFLLGAGGAGAAFLLPSCSGENDLSARSPVDEASVIAHRVGYPGDLRTVALAVALENQAVGVYTSALSAARSGRLGTVPRALTSLLTRAMAQHTDHAKVWNGVLTRAGKPALTDVPLSDQKEITATLAKATTAADAAALALQLEEQAAQTYLMATYGLDGASERETAATIAPVEAMHASILRFLLGQYPVPDAFLHIERAARPSLLTV
ncbi:ferritin-like domain-containing protein [Streptomyces sp. NPDC051662]|uniref:ferritin-like domain-containing protein n=1 Tax=Streptomyces sp. NPDC051662 TaxID=3154750 RepID=UPI003440F0F8